MRTSHDDMIHPVPPIAYLRWKENYFFVIQCREQGVFGVAHVSCEPIFERMRLAMVLDVAGKQYHYKKESPLPAGFGFGDTITDGKMTVSIVKTNEELRVSVDDASFQADLHFSARLPAYEFGASRYAAPENYSYKEAMTFGTNLPFEHIQQSMMVSGSVSLADTGRTIDLDGYGYRDHSWGMRTDNSVAWHVWSGLNFPDRVFGIMSLEILGRRGLVAKEGYVADADGVRSLRRIELRQEGKSDDGLPQKQIFDVTDVFGNTYVVEADIAGRRGQVVHENEKADKQSGATGYTMTENFCDLRLVGSDERGFGLVELGYTNVPQA